MTEDEAKQEQIECCDVCRAPVVREGDRVQFDSSRYHMDAVKKLSEISALQAHIEDLEALLTSVAHSGIEHQDARIGYVSVQVEWDVWCELEALAALQTDSVEKGGVSDQG